MSATISFYAAAVIAVVAALGAVCARRSDQALAGLAVALAALLVPLVQLEAVAVAAVLLLGVVVSLVLLGALARIGPRTQTSEATGLATARRAPIVYWVIAGLGVAGFGWVLLATGTRQVVDHGDPGASPANFGDGSEILLALGSEFMVPALLVALLALCAVIAAVLAELKAAA